jgi:predicted N-acetyltransferase YhbS
MKYASHYSPNATGSTRRARNFFDFKMKLRRAIPSDMHTIYAMGFDAWGEGKSVEERIRSCEASKKYPLGKWYVLADEQGPVSSLICYREAFGLAPGIVGIGTVATTPAQRGKGYATQLMTLAMAEICKSNDVDAFFLFSDISPAMYERLGFVALPRQYQEHKDSIAMIRPVGKTLDALLHRDFKPPLYF